MPTRQGAGRSRREEALRRPGRGSRVEHPDQFAAFIRDEMAKYAKLIKEANIKVNP
jgi:tripartite-type tricarboxylate transporter receptor subunit TctC